MLKEKINVFGIPYDNLRLDESVHQMEEYIKERTPRMVFNTGAELVVRAYKDRSIMKIYENTSLITPDSQVVYWACRILGKKIKEPVSSVRLMFRFLELTKGKGYRLYFLGARQEVLEKAVENIKNNYPGSNIVGYHNGYFDFNNDSKVVEEIAKTKPDIVFVAMSSPLKEKFVSKNFKRIGAPVCFGVGGSVDVAAGYCTLAPNWISKIGLEWFYRFLQEPVRLGRRYLVMNFEFILIVLREFFKNEKSNSSKSTA